MLDTRPLLLETDFPAIRRQAIDTLQVNLGYRCNMSCVHCHVNAGPTRTEAMSGETVDQLLTLLDHLRPRCLDLTGGAPELNPHFRRLACAAIRPRPGAERDHGRKRRGWTDRWRCFACLICPVCSGRRPLQHLHHARFRRSDRRCR